MTRSYLLSSLLIFALAACAGGGSAEDAAGGGQGGNVGFGGAQDIGQFRDILRAGDIPGADTLDANGFFNEHYTELPAPDCGQPMCLHGMVSVNRDWVDNGYQAVLRVALNTPVDASELPERPLDLVVVVDTSGSMAADDRLSYVQQGLSLLIDQLDDEDRLGIVQYSTDASLVAGLGEATREEMHDLVNDFTAAGGTNIYAGMQIGMQMASENLSPERQSRVILLSDGLITEGRSQEDVIALSEGYVADGVGLTTIGVGDSFNVELMRGLAESGAGNFYYVEDPSAVTEVFTEELDYFVQPLALDLQVDVQSAPSHRIGQVYGTRLWQSWGSDGGQMNIPAVFLSSRTSDEPGTNGRRGGGSSLFITMDPVNGGSFASEAMATIRVTYRLPGTDETVEQELVVDNPFREEVPDAGYVTHIEMLEAYAMYNIFLGLHQAATEAASDYHCSLETIDALTVSTQRWIENNPDSDFSEDLELMSLFAQNLRRVGADASLCSQAYDDFPYGDDIYYDMPRACSVGGSGHRGSAGLLLLALGALRMRRRSRRS